MLQKSHIIRTPWFRYIILSISLCVLFAISAAGTIEAKNGLDASDINAVGKPDPTWSYVLQDTACGGGKKKPHCQDSSPAIVDINGDGFDDIIVGTAHGHVIALNHEGSLIWDVDVAPSFGRSANSQAIHSSPTIADIDNDGKLEVIIGVGSTQVNNCTKGGVIVLSDDGKVKPGWPKTTTGSDLVVNAAACQGKDVAESVFGTPGVGNLDDDPELEIVVGAFDKHIYMWNHDGTELPGSNPDSYLLGEDDLSNWTHLRNKLADTIWSSPVLYDLDGDGYDEIILGTDEGFFGPPHNQDSNWTCPYALPPGWLEGYCGGSLYVIDRHGNNLPGFPIYIKEIIQSTPAITDLDGDGQPDIIIGTGVYYNKKNGTELGFRVYAWNNRGQALPGWEGGKATGGVTPSSPSIGDIAGDSKPEVIIGTKDERKIYAFHHNGQPVAGFPMAPVDWQKNSSGSFNVGTGYALGDTDGDGKMEIVFGQSSSMNIVDGDGTQLTAKNEWGSPERPLYYIDGGKILNTPALGDIDNDGKLEVVINNGTMHLWELDSSTAAADWPMFMRTASRSSIAPFPPTLNTSPSSLNMFNPEPFSQQPAQVTIQNPSEMTINWSVELPAGVGSSDALSGSLTQGTQSINISVEMGDEGSTDLGDIVVTATDDKGVALTGSPTYIPVSSLVADEIVNYLPMISREQGDGIKESLQYPGSTLAGTAAGLSAQTLAILGATALILGLAAAGFLALRKREA